MTPQVHWQRSRTARVHAGQCDAATDRVGVTGPPRRHCGSRTADIDVHPVAVAGDRAVVRDHAVDAGPLDLGRFCLFVLLSSTTLSKIKIKIKDRFNPLTLHRFNVFGRLGHSFVIRLSRGEALRGHSPAGAGASAKAGVSSFLSPLTSDRLDTTPF